MVGPPNPGLDQLGSVPSQAGSAHLTPILCRRGLPDSYMAGSLNPSAPKILLAKPSAGPVPGKFGRGGNEDEGGPHRSRLPPVGSLNLLSDSWGFHIDRFLPFLTENTDFTVIGVIGPPGVGKSTIMNQLYGFEGTSPGMLPPFAVQSEETRALAKHTTVGIEPRISAERFILLDTQPVFSPSVLSEIMRPDGSSTVSVLNGEALSAELAHEVMNIQLGVLLASVCHILVVVSEGVHDYNMWLLMSVVDLLKHGIPDPSCVSSPHAQSSNFGFDKENKEKVYQGEEYMASPVFVHTKLQNRDCGPSTISQLKAALSRYFCSSSFIGVRRGKITSDHSAQKAQFDSTEKTPLNLFGIPRNKDCSPTDEFASYTTMLCKLRDQVLSMGGSSFAKSVSEREWLKSSAKIWELVKSSPVIAEYSNMLSSSGMFRR